MQESKKIQNTNLNYWCLLDRNKKTIIRFPYIASGKTIDVYPSEYEVDIIGKVGEKEVSAKHLKMFISSGHGKQEWKPGQVLGAFLTLIPVSEIMKGEFKDHKRVNIINYIYYLYTQPEQYVVFNTEMMIKQYIRTSDYMMRSIVSSSLFDIIRKNFPSLHIVCSIFWEENYEKVLEARKILVKPIVGKVEKASIEKEIIAKEQAKGKEAQAIGNHVEATIRIFQKDLYQFIKKTLNSVYAQLQQDENTNINSFLRLNYLPMLHAAKTHNSYVVICEFYKRYDSEYYNLDDYEKKNITNLLEEVNLWHTFIYLFQIMEKKLKRETMKINYSIKDFFKETIDISIRDIEGIKIKDKEQYNLSHTTKKKIISILHAAISTYITTFSDVNVLIICNTIAQEYSGTQKEPAYELNNGIIQDIQEEIKKRLGEKV